MSKESKNFDSLIELMLFQAQKFLEEMGEFFPYASVLTSSKELSTIGIFNDDDDNFNAQKAIDIFTNKIKQGIDSGEILIGAIGVDVLLKESNQNAIMVKVTDNGVKWHNRNFIYKITNNRVEIESKY